MALRNQITIFCLRDDPLIAFQKQNHVTFIFLKTMSHDLLVQVAYSRIKLAIYLTLFRAVSMDFFFATKIFKHAAKFSKQVAKYQLNFFVNFKPWKGS